MWIPFAQVGPGSYEPGYNNEANSYVEADAIRSDWSKNVRHFEPNAVKYQKSLPTFEFNLDDETDRNWNHVPAGIDADSDGRGFQLNHNIRQKRAQIFRQKCYKQLGNYKLLITKYQGN